MFPRTVAAAATLAFFLLAPVRVYAAAGDLDPTFANAGRLAAPEYSFAEDVGLQSDGKIVIAFWSGGWQVRRYNTNGTLDLTFGSGGTSANPFAITATPQALAVQSDDSIVVAGIANGGTPDMDFAVSRFEPDGDVDATFGTGGVVVTAFGTGVDRARDVAIQADGKIVVVGDAEIGGNTDLAVARYDSSGLLDAGFGTGGLVTNDVGSDADILLAVAPDNDGRIVAAGIYGSVGYYAVVARYEDDGDLDPTFDGDGIVLNPYAMGSEPYSIVVQPDDRIVVGGMIDYRMAVSRFEDNGALDASFGDGGLRKVHELGVLSYAYDVALQPNGSIVAAGTADDVNSLRDFAVARFLPNGSLDPTFNDGFTTTDFGLKNDHAFGVAVQDDGNVVAAGSVEAGTNDYHAALVRYEGVGPCEPGPAADADGDFLCDAADPCHNPGGARDFTEDPPAFVKLKKIIGDTTPGDDGLQLRASFDLALPEDFAAFDPLADGARLIVARRSGNVVSDIALPAAQYTGGSTAGWMQKSANRWRYLDKSGSPLNGVVKVDVAARASVPGRVILKVVAKRGSYPLIAADLPLSATFVLGDAAASDAGRCGEGDADIN